MTGVQERIPRLKIPGGFVKSEHQGFRNFEEAVDLIHNYCNQCRLGRECVYNKELRMAMGNNYPCWFDVFVKIEPREVSSDLRTKVMCRDYQDKQLEFGFVGETGRRK